MKAKTVTTRCWAEASPSAPAPAVSPPAKPRGRSSAPPGPMFCHSRHGSPRRGPNGKTPALAPHRLHFARGETALAGHRPHLLGLPRKIGRGVSPRETTRCGLSASRPWLRHPAPLFCRPRHGCAAPGPQRQNHGACSRSVAFRPRRNRAAVISALLPGTIVNRPGFLYNKRQDSYHT